MGRRRGIYGGSYAAGAESGKEYRRQTDHEDSGVFVHFDQHFSLMKIFLLMDKTEKCNPTQKILIVCSNYNEWLLLRSYRVLKNVTKYLHLSPLKVRAFLYADAGMRYNSLMYGC
jgi:hypothetical protein